LDKGATQAGGTGKANAASPARKYLNVLRITQDDVVQLERNPNPVFTGRNAIRLKAAILVRNELYRLSIPRCLLGELYFSLRERPWVATTMQHLANDSTGTLDTNHPHVILAVHDGQRLRMFGNLFPRYRQHILVRANVLEPEGTIGLDSLAQGRQVACRGTAHDETGRVKAARA
jgi:hypothetical protein